MEAGSTNETSKDVAKIVCDSFKNNLSLPSEFFKVTPKTPDDHQHKVKMLQDPKTNLRVFLAVAFGVVFSKNGDSYFAEF